MDMRSYLDKILYHIYKLKGKMQFRFCSRSVAVINAVFGFCQGSFLNSNWGDDINYILPKLVAGKNCVPYMFFNDRKRNKKNILCVGSIIQWQCNRNSIIWGSGVISDECELPEKPKKVLAVRGPLTRKWLLEKGVDCPEVYGDPVLLLPQYYTPKVEKKYKLGIIPHKSMWGDIMLFRFMQEQGITVINIADYGKQWQNFINKVAECENIVSSSLHGLIIAEAYNIPSQWIKINNNLIGGDFKFYDFYESISKTVKPIVLTENSTVEELIAECKKWHPGMIDLRPLLRCCPF